MRTRLQMILALAGLLLAAPAVQAQRSDSYLVVVSASNPVSTMDAREVSRMFRKEVTRWQHGAAVTPVDQRVDSPTRAAFSQSVHGRGVALIAEFWRQQIFSGRNVPPVEKTSDAEVIEAVRANPGAIGYVSSRASLGPDVKVVTVNGAK